MPRKELLIIRQEYLIDFWILLCYCIVLWHWPMTSKKLVHSFERHGQKNLSLPIFFFCQLAVCQLYVFIRVSSIYNLLNKFSIVNRRHVVNMKPMHCRTCSLYIALILWELPSDWSKWACYHLLSQSDKVYHKNSLMCKFVIPSCQSLTLIGCTMNISR